MQSILETHTVHRDEHDMAGGITMHKGEVMRGALQHVTGGRLIEISPEGHRITPRDIRYTPPVGRLINVVHAQETGVKVEWLDG